MKKLMPLLILSLFVCSSAFAGSFSLEILKQESRKALSGNVNIVSESQDDGAASVAYSQGESNFQFTLSSDKQSQMPSEKKITIAGRKAEFFRPMGESSGGLFIPLENNSGSLVVIIMNGMFSDDVVTSDALKKKVEKMDLSLFDK